MLSTHQPLTKIGTAFIKLLEVDSTNNYAHKLIKQQYVNSGTVISAQHQTKGKGQKGKIWNAAKNQNITLSIILDISSIPIQKQFILSAYAAVCCYDFLENYLPKHAAIKWPNDLYYYDKKAGGILIETINHNHSRTAIIGIGLNINQTEFDKNLRNPTSLKANTGIEYYLNDLIEELLACFNNRLANLYANHPSIIDDFNKNLFKKGSIVTLRKDNIKFNCTIQSVNEFGELLVKDGLKDSFQFGEVEWVL